MTVAEPGVASPREGWRALKTIFRLWGVTSAEDLCAWIARHDPRREAPRPRDYLHRDAQEYIFDTATASDAEVAGIHAAYVAATRQLASERGLRRELLSNLAMRRRQARSPTPCATPAATDAEEEQAPSSPSVMSRTSTVASVGPGG